MDSRKRRELEAVTGHPGVLFVTPAAMARRPDGLWLAYREREFKKPHADEHGSGSPSYQVPALLYDAQAKAKVALFAEAIGKWDGPKPAAALTCGVCLN